MLGIKCRLTVCKANTVPTIITLTPLKWVLFRGIEEEEGENLFCLQLKIISGLGH